MLIVQYKASFTYERLVRCFRFAYWPIFVLALLCISCCYRVLVNEDL